MKLRRCAAHQAKGWASWTNCERKTSATTVTSPKPRRLASCCGRRGGRERQIWRKRSSSQAMGRPGEAPRKAVIYYTHNARRMDYARFRAAGYQIGSGTIESGCKQIATQRLKRSGARWTLESARMTAKALAGWLMC